MNVCGGEKNVLLLASKTVSVSLCFPIFIPKNAAGVYGKSHQPYIKSLFTHISLHILTF